MGLSINVEWNLDIKNYLDITVDQVHLYTWMVFPDGDGYSHQVCTQLELSPTGSRNMTATWRYYHGLIPPPDLNIVEHLRDAAARHLEWWSSSSSEHLPVHRCHHLASAEHTCRAILVSHYNSVTSNHGWSEGPSWPNMLLGRHSQWSATSVYLYVLCMAAFFLMFYYNYT